MPVLVLAVLPGLSRLSRLPMSRLPMSRQWYRWAREQAGVSGSAKAVLLELGERAGEDGACWPSVGTIARDTGLSRSTVQRALAVLVAAGLVTRVRWQGGDGGDTSNYYYVGPSMEAGGVTLERMQERRR